MIRVSQSRSLYSRALSIALLIAFGILGGCSRGPSADQAQRPERSQQDAREKVAVDDERDRAAEAARAEQMARAERADRSEEMARSRAVETDRARAAELAQTKELARSEKMDLAAMPRASMLAPEIAAEAANISESALVMPPPPPPPAHRSARVMSDSASESKPMGMPPKPPPSLAFSASPPNSPPVGDAGGPGDHRSQLPAGSHRGEEGFATVQVFYATDRQRGVLPLSAYEMTGQKQTFLVLCGCSLLLIAFSAVSSIRGRTRTGALSAVTGGIAAALAAGLVVVGQANIEKHGVTYTGDRGLLTRGVCKVTVPDSHRRGMVERPSLLRFEFREDQQKHIVLTRAVELSGSDFRKRLATTVADSPEKDLLVFIHGYNVDFESAVQRTAQIAVDLPFEGVPVCYSWPSQGTLIGYPIDENNSQWTVAHLKEFLLELAEESGADSINVVAHSMGNRALTNAMQHISWQVDGGSDAPFDRLVLAAPDVDADHFRRDLAPALLKVANQVTLYASSDDQALIASKGVHGYPRAGESGENIVVVSGIETIDVSGIDLSLLGHSYYGDNESILRDLYDVVRARLPAPERGSLIARQTGTLVYWQLAQSPANSPQPSTR